MSPHSAIYPRRCRDRSKCRGARDSRFEVACRCAFWRSVPRSRCHSVRATKSGVWVWFHTVIPSQGLYSSRIRMVTQAQEAAPVGRGHSSSPTVNNTRLRGPWVARLTSLPSPTSSKHLAHGRLLREPGAHPADTACRFSTAAPIQSVCSHACRSTFLARSLSHTVFHSFAERRCLLSACGVSCAARIIQWTQQSPLTHTRAVVVVGTTLAAWPAKLRAARHSGQDSSEGGAVAEGGLWGPRYVAPSVCPSTAFAARLHTHAACCTLPRILLEVRRAHVLSQPVGHVAMHQRHAHSKGYCRFSGVQGGEGGCSAGCAVLGRAPLVASRGSDCWRAPETRLAGKPASPVASPPAPALLTFGAWRLGGRRWNPPWAPDTTPHHPQPYMQGFCSQQLPVWAQRMRRSLLLLQGRSHARAPRQLPRLPAASERASADGPGILCAPPASQCHTCTTTTNHQKQEDKQAAPGLTRPSPPLPRHPLSSRLISLYSTPPCPASSASARQSTTSPPRRSLQSRPHTPLARSLATTTTDRRRLLRPPRPLPPTRPTTPT